MPDQAEHELNEQAAAVLSCSQDLQRDLADLAGRIAQTFDEIARVHEHIATSGVSRTAAQALEHAHVARGFAEHERHEQRRWAPTEKQP